MRAKPEDAFKDLTSKTVSLAARISSKKDTAHLLPTPPLAKARQQSILALAAITKVVNELFEADQGRPPNTDRQQMPYCPGGRDCPYACQH